MHNFLKRGGEKIMNTKTTVLFLVLILAFVMHAGTATAVYAKESTRKISDTIETAVADINSASADELQLISGIGPKLAARIIQYRKTNGQFQAVKDIMKVKGVGQSKFEKIRDQLTV